MSSEDLVRAAGGVIWRRRRSPAAIWRSSWSTGPSYDDWSLPKGKVDPGETDERTALREVEEETVAGVPLGPELPQHVYRDRTGGPRWSGTGP